MEPKAVNSSFDRYMSVINPPVYMFMLNVLSVYLAVAHVLRTPYKGLR